MTEIDGKRSKQDGDAKFSVPASRSGTGREHPGDAALWRPGHVEKESSNLARFIRSCSLESFDALGQWSFQDVPGYLARLTKALGIQFKQKPVRYVEQAESPEQVAWFSGARLNIVDSCFQADSDKLALVVDVGDHIRRYSYGELRTLSARVANGLRSYGVGKGDRVGICTTMSAEAIAIVLGAISVGAAVVTIADTFSGEEIASRLLIGGVNLVFIEEAVRRADKRFALYQRLLEAAVVPAVVLVDEEQSGEIAAGDLRWDEFLSNDENLPTESRSPQDEAVILFSSGTTGDPKAIVWDHTTPIKCAGDAYFHQDVQPQDIVCWPTSLGWMMGPWLVFGVLINKGAIALGPSPVISQSFVKFVEEAKVSILGLVPSMVAGWRRHGWPEVGTWRHIKLFSSSGECSNPHDMEYLVAQTGRPVIEYCGGTEIGGAYVTSSLLHDCVPGYFRCAAIGSSFVVLDANGAPATEGEAFIRAPSLGLSRVLLNRDHHKVYYADVPAPPGIASSAGVLRRHGDLISAHPGGLYRVTGRTDDAINLAGIKVGTAQIEAVILQLAAVREAAAIGFNPLAGGPSRLVVYCVMQNDATEDPEALRHEFQRQISKRLNPQFRVHDVAVVDALPRTASGKIMRRTLQQRYREERGGVDV